MASSSSKRKRTYDVFLSFRGPDVRNNFLGHLYTALDQIGLYTYIDDKELEKGEQISSALMKAIEESRIAIVIFSKDYASSSWCLEELEKILECKTHNDLIVLPVFYKVEPREVRTGRESYQAAMVKHESQKESDTVERWKKALYEAGNLSGWNLNDGDEASLVKRIVEEISKHLDRTAFFHVAKHPVGIHSRVVELKSMLNLESDDNVLMIGLWGHGGIGKTTVAKALYNYVFRQFESSCFLANVREASKDSKDLVPLQKQLLFEILRKELTVFSVDVGKTLIQNRLSCKKVLLVLDDVDDLKQLNALAGDSEWFGKGSRIIVTTRDRHLLTSHGIDEKFIYKVKFLKDGEAFELFHKHVFRRNSKIAIRRDLVESALRYAGRLPLALEVLGSFLCDKREPEWEDALNKLAESPDKDINNVLKLSYDGLDEYGKEIFLDIACFFKGRYIWDINKILDSCGFHPTIGVRILIEKSLIIEYGGILCMHDLIQLMGMNIVKQECHDDPGRRSRIWHYDDVCDVLSGDMGTDAVKAIVLILPEPKEIYIDPNAFNNMKRLRLLMLINVHNSCRDPISLPNELRWFEWPECPPWFPNFSPGRKKLVGLDLHQSNIQVVREQFKGFDKLKFINLSKCQSLVCMPDLSYSPHLEILDLGWCKNLEHVDGSFAYLRKLWRLVLSGCSKLQRFPDIPAKNKSLQELNLFGSSIEELPVSIENLVNLKMLLLADCKKLTIVPSSIYRLQNLELLDLIRCSKLIKFPKTEENWSEPHAKTGFLKLKQLILTGCNLSEIEFLENLSCFPSLRRLSLLGNNFTNLPPCEHLCELQYLNVSDCQQLQEIHKTPEKLLHLSAIGCKSLSRISSNIYHAGSIELTSCQELVRNGLSVNDLFMIEQFLHRPIDVVLPGEEIPKLLLPSEGGYISFVASKDLYNKLLGVAFSVVCRQEENSPISFLVSTYINGRQHDPIDWQLQPFNCNHVWLHYGTIKEDWGVADFDSDDYRYFHIHVRAQYRVLVKECGFRLICKPLGNDLKVLLQNGRLLNPALIYEVGYDDSQMSTMKECSSETRDLQDSQRSMDEDISSESAYRRLKMVDLIIEETRFDSTLHMPRKIRSGGEMPKEFVLVESSTISFMASQDLYNKFVGLALCVVFGVEDGKKEVSIHIGPRVDGRMRNGVSGTLGSFDSDHTWIQFLDPNMLWGLLEGAIDFSQFKKDI